MNTAKVSLDELNKMESLVDSKSTSDIMEFRGHVSILKNGFRSNAFNIDPVNTTIYENAFVTITDIDNTKDAVKGVNSIARKAQREGIAEAESILAKFSKPSVDTLTVGSQPLGLVAAGLRPIEELKNSSSMPLQAVGIAADMAGKSVEEIKKIHDRTIIETAQAVDKVADKSVQIVNGVAQFAMDNNPLVKKATENLRDGVGEILKECIPCSLRNLDFTAEFGMPWLKTIEDMKKKWNDLLAMLKSLSATHPGEFSMDLCNLMKFLDVQCIPDIVGILSLLTLMRMKYMDLSISGMNNIINQLIAPFLTPVVGAFTSNLDKYADLIIGPLKCVVAALELQTSKLQEQIKGAVNIADQNKNKYQQKQIEFIEAKAKSLRNRRLDLVKMTDIADNNSTTRNTSGLPGTRQDRIAESKFFKGGVKVLGADETINTTYKINDKGDLEAKKYYQLSNEQEVDNIDVELRKLTAQRKALQGEIRGRSPNSAVNPNTLQGSALAGAEKLNGLSAQTRVALNNMERINRSITADLTDAINDGVGIIKQSIDIYREEFQRLLLGRIATQEDQIEFTRMIQQFARLVSICKAIYDLKKNGFNFMKLCEQGEKNALGQVAKGLKENSDKGMFDFYEATDADGKSLIVIAPGGAKVSVSSIDFNAAGDEALFGDSLVDLKSFTKTVTFNDLNEVDKLNREGIVPDLGNIDSKNIEIDVGARPGSELDLHFKSSYAIISNEFCSKSAIDFGSSDTVKKWAASLWQKE